jgi:hypothetical protein
LQTNIHIYDVTAHESNEKGPEPKADAYIGLILVLLAKYWQCVQCLCMYMDMLESAMSNYLLRRNFMFYTK